MENWTQKSYYEHLLEVANSMRTGTYDAKEWMVEYDRSSKICFRDQENIVYYANKKLFETLSKTDIDKDTYVNITQSMSRIGAFIHRFWIPVHRNAGKDVEPLFELATKIWDSNHT